MVISRFGHFRKTDILDHNFDHNSSETLCTYYHILELKKRYFVHYVLFCYTISIMFGPQKPWHSRGQRFDFAYLPKMSKKVLKLNEFRTFSLLFGLFLWDFGVDR